MSDDLSVEEIKRMRLCVCGHYKKTQYACCHDCQMAFINKELWPKCGPRPSDEDASLIRQTLLESISFLMQRSLDSVASESSEMQRYFYFKFLANHGVNIGSENFRWFKSRHRKFNTGHGLSYGRLCAREEITAHQSKNLPPIISGGFQP